MRLFVRSLRSRLPALLALLAVGAAGCGAPSPAAHAKHPAKPPTAVVHYPPYDPAAFQAGINLLVYGSNPYLGTLPQLMRKWRQWGVKDVAIAYPLYQGGVQSVDIGPGKETPTPAALRGLITRLENGGFVVMMRPLLDEASLHPSWRGAIIPSNVSTWFSNYARALVAEATLAQTLHVAQFDVGTELSSLQGDTPQWTELISQVRGVFHGTLLYSCNWNDTTPEPWFAQLDAIGVDAYYPVNVPSGATTAQISAVLAQDAAQLPNYNKPVWITEAGLVPVAGAYQVPYSPSPPGSKYDPTAQAQYYQAFCQAFSPSVKGLYWWSSDLGSGAANTLSYDPTPQAGAAMAACFTQAQGSAAAQ